MLDVPLNTLSGDTLKDGESEPGRETDRDSDLGARDKDRLCDLSLVLAAANSILLHISLPSAFMVSTS